MRLIEYPLYLSKMMDIIGTHDIKVITGVRHESSQRRTVSNDSLVYS